MRYGTEGSPGPWRLTLTLTDEPRCPGCAEFLQPCVVVIRDGWGWCGLCDSMNLPAQPHLRFILEHELLIPHTAVAHGVRFYTPQRFTGSPKCVFEFYEEYLSLDCYALTREGNQRLEEHELTGTQLP